MKYAIIGAGGTGGTLGFYLTEAGKDVTLIARGYHLEAMQKQGLTMRQLWDGKEETIPVKACRMEEYTEQPDVILVCVKGYSLTNLIPDIRRIAGPKTVVLTVPDGCIYVSAAIEEPGVILRHGRILRVVFGARTPSEETESMRAIARDMLSENLEVILSPDIRRDAMVKFSYVSPIGTAGLYYNATAVDFQQEGEKREMICELMREIVNLSHAMGIEFEEDLVERNLKILLNLAPESTTSMQRDVMAGKQSEIDGLVYEVVRMGREYGVPMSEYEKAAVQFQKQGL